MTFQSTRFVFCVIIVAFFVWLVIAVRSVHAAVPPRPDGETAAPPAAAGAGVLLAPPLADFVGSVQVTALRRKLAREHQRLLSARARVRTLQRTLAHTTTTREAIGLACQVYGNCGLLWRRAECESGLYPLARNASGASGLFQFLPGTWATTPFASFSVWSPYANALAAGWMQTHGRGGEWVCG